MSFDWSDYLILAKELAGLETSPASNEAKLRSAISRAYYATFCLARDHLRDKEKRLIPYDEPSHKYVIDTLRNSSIKERKVIGLELNRLKIDRNKADYNNEFSDLDSKVRVVLALAKQVEEKLKSLEVKPDA